MLSVDKMKKSELIQYLSVYDKYIITSLTDTKGIIQDASNAFCEISGYFKEELIGQPHNIVRHPDTPSEVFQELWDTIQSGKQWQGEIKNRKKNGGHYWVMTTVYPRFDDEQNIIGYFSLRQDITSSKELQEQEKILKEHDKNALMGEMIGLIAHQWVQPLSTISSAFSNLSIKMELGTLTNEDMKNTREYLDTSIQFLSETVDNFRNYFKNDVHLSMLSMIELVKYPLLISDPLLKKNKVTLDFSYNSDIKESDWMIKTVSKNDFAHVILNLIKNAVEVLVSNEIKDSKITISVDKIDKNFIINVADNGGGIDEKILPNIFAKGYSSKGDRGTGLGMYMTRKILKDHLNGTIEAYNDEDGANFTITIPEIV